jgi:hypothetical protein
MRRFGLPQGRPRRWGGRGTVRLVRRQAAEVIRRQSTQGAPRRRHHPGNRQGQTRRPGHERGSWQAGHRSPQGRAGHRYHDRPRLRRPESCCKTPVPSGVGSGRGGGFDRPHDADDDFPPPVLRPHPVGLRRSQRPQAGRRATDHVRHGHRQALAAVDQALLLPDRLCFRRRRLLRTTWPESAADLFQAGEVVGGQGDACAGEVLAEVGDGGGAGDEQDVG